MVLVRRVVLAAILLGGCSTGKLGTGSTTIAGAAATSAAAVGAAFAERAAGGCIAICTAGTACNRNNGLCEPMPCRGECGSNEHCEQTFSGEKCVAGGPTSVEALVKPRTPLLPGVMPAVAPPQNGSPTIVPTAEQAPPH
jgi:hypothetical protein